jgi:hypothetical protein
MFLNPLLKADLVNRTFLLGTIRTLSFGGDTIAHTLDGTLAGRLCLVLGRLTGRTVNLLGLG